jgi:phosphoribosylaminoimidazolecarboxamide formyltransferase/IMP cyclohydrolase
MKKALISVSDKEGIVELAQHLISQGYELVGSYGSTNYLKQNGIECTFISDYINFDETLDGRVKTLHPKIYTNILNILPNNDETIDVIVVNLYPFQVFQSVNNIDIGGVSLLRAGAKNYKHKIVLSNPSQYISYINNDFNQKDLAMKAFNLTSEYDHLITEWLMKE